MKLLSPLHNVWLALHRNEDRVQPIRWLTCCWATTRVCDANAGGWGERDDRATIQFVLARSEVVRSNVAS